MKKINLLGKRFGRWLVVAPTKSKTKTKWICQCDCGAKKPVRSSSLVNGDSVSCGCYADELKHKYIGTSINWKSPEYYVWSAMIQRCHNPKTTGYHNYGGRGISVCPEWRGSFLKFFNSVGARPSNKHSIDRINNDGNYEPGNVRWATRREQNLNTRRTIR